MKYALILLTVALSGCVEAIESLADEHLPSANPVQREPPLAEGEWRIEFLDVGQGDSILIMGPEYLMVYDTARWTRDSYGVLLDRIAANGYTTVDDLVLSHPDGDHIGGCRYVFESYQVLATYHPGMGKDTRSWEACIEAIRSEPNHVEWTDNELSIGATIEMAPGAVATILWVDGQARDPNSGSLTLLLDIGSTSVLLPGDLGCEQEEQVLQNVDVDVDVHMLGHHGSYSASCAAFLDATTPDVAVVSSAWDSQYGHPHDVVLERIGDRSIPFYWTGYHGTISMTIHNGTVAWATTNGHDVLSEDPR